MPESAVANAAILVVDDMVANVLLLERMLASGGFSNVRGQTNPRAVFRDFLDFKPDIILLDLQMPEMNGLSVLKGLAGVFGPDALPPILVISGDDDDDKRAAAIAAGACDFLTKPFEFKVVLDRITRRLTDRLSARPATP